MSLLIWFLSFRRYLAIESIARWQACLESSGSIPLEGQNELRSLLQSLNDPETETRNRLLSLLNPLCAEIVHLSDQQLEQDFIVVTQDNYRRLPCRGITRDGLQFDANHGYYVVLNVEPLE